MSEPSVSERLENYLQLSGAELDGDTKQTLVALYERQAEIKPAPRLRFAKWFEDLSLGEIVAATEAQT